jgi:hypothetical protein
MKGDMLRSNVDFLFLAAFFLGDRDRFFADGARAVARWDLISIPLLRTPGIPSL